MFNRSDSLAGGVASPGGISGELSSEELAQASPVFALFILRHELECAGARTRAPCGHERADICRPLFGDKLQPKLRALVQNLDGMLPFPNLANQLDDFDADGEKITRAKLSSWITLLEQAAARIPTDAPVPSVVPAGPCLVEHLNEERSRALRLKCVLEILLARLHSLRHSGSASFVEADGFKRAWEAALTRTTSHPRS